MFLDIAFGLFLAKYYSISIILGIFFALLPDIDFIPEYFYNKTKSKYLKMFAHRGILHTPIIYLLIACILFVLNFNLIIIKVFLLGTLYHLFHDLFVLGRGIMIFYPFSKKRLKIFPDDGADGYLKNKLLWWDENLSPKYDFEIVTAQTSQLHNDNWIRTWYFRPNMFLFSEILLTILFIFLFISIG